VTETFFFQQSLFSVAIVKATVF